MGRRPTALRPLRHRDFALLWAAAATSNVGTWMQAVAVGIFVTELTGQARWAGLVAAAAFLPIGLLAPFGGALADRHDRRRFLLLTTLGETALAGLLAVLTATGHASPASIVAVVFLGSAMASLGLPAYQAMLPDLVPADDLLGAVSLGSVQYNLGRVLGPALAGVVVSVGSYTWAFVVNTVSFGAVVVALLFVRLPPTASDESTDGMWARIREGARVVAAEPGCRTAILLMGTAAFFVSPFIALVPAFAQVLLHGDGGDTAILVTAQGIGAVAGALALTGRADRHGRQRTLLTDLAAVCVALLLYAAAPSVATAALAIVLVGAAYIGVLAGLNTVVQLRAPAATRARALSLWMLALGTVYPVGAVVQGVVADHSSLRVVTAAGAVLMLVVLAALVRARPDLMRALGDLDSAEG